MLPLYNTHRQQNNIKNPENELIVKEPVDNVQVTNEKEKVMEEIQEIVVRRFERKRTSTISKDYKIYKMD